MLSPLVLKLLLVPACIGLVSLAERRWGPAVAGWLAGLPVVVGPILFLLWLEQGAGFARNATVYSLAAVAPVTAFAVTYASCSRRWPWTASTLLAYSMWLLFAVAVRMLPIGLVSAAVLAVASLVAAPRVFPREIAAPVMTRRVKVDIKLRMLAGAVLTLLVTSIADIGGARASGLLSMFPVLSSILAVSIHRRGGSVAATAALRGLASGLWSLAAFCITLVVIPAQGVGYAFGTATVIAIAVQALAPRR